MSFLWYWPAGGWDFDVWKRRQTWEPITSPQSGQRDPLPLVQTGDWVRVDGDPGLVEIRRRPPDGDRRAGAF